MNEHPFLLMVCLGLAVFGLASCASRPGDASSSASRAISVPSAREAAAGTKALIVLAASPAGSTAKVAGAIAEELGARVVGPDRVDALVSGEYRLIGFGSGIFDATNHPALLALAEALPEARNAKAFIFSTNGAPARIVDAGTAAGYTQENHAALRAKLAAKGYEIAGEFGCPGFNDNGFLMLFGGLNRGRPNAADLELARSFARGLLYNGEEKSDDASGDEGLWGTTTE